MDWQFAPDIKSRLNRLLSSGLFPHISSAKLTVLRGHGSTGRAIARIWSLPRPWQLTLKITPQYIIEVIAERFDRLASVDQDRTLIHELMHIPKTFSGALVSHRGRGRRINNHSVELLYQQYLANKK